MSLNLYYTKTLPNDLKKIINIMSFNESEGYSDNILSTGLQTYNKDKIYEIWESTDNVKEETYKNINIRYDKDYLFGSVIFDSLCQFEENYKDILTFTRKFNYRLIKLWHFIPNLLDINEINKSTYTIFCEEREKLYKAFFTNNNYPAATVVGTKGKKIIIYFIASSYLDIFYLSNSRQIEPYKYPKEIFQYKPLFSRAIKLGKQKEDSKIFISGTASISGYQSKHASNLSKQFNEIILNYKNLLNITSDFSSKNDIYRIYIKNNINVDTIKEYIQKNFNENRYLIIFGDICRSELLIEIDGIKTNT